MGLLLNSGIEVNAGLHLRGKIARIGGRMNQLMDYRNCRVTDINIPDGGYGKVRLGLTLKSLKNTFFTLRRQIRQELSWILKGEREIRDRKTIILDMHFAMLNSTLENRFDASVSSNVIEHSPNPVWLLLNFYFITKKEGYQYHAIPHYRFIFDQFREPTPTSHFFEDFEKFTWFGDTTHNEDYIMSAIEKHGWQKTFHEKYPVAYPYMHFHVFDEYNLRELADTMFEEVKVDILKTDKFNDNLLFFRNRLKPSFEQRYFTRIEAYKQFVMRK